MKTGAGNFGAHLKALRETAGYTQEELATIAGLSVYAVSALERGERRRPQLETVRALSAALDLTGAARDAFIGSARARDSNAPGDEQDGSALPLPPTSLLGRVADVQTLHTWLADPGVRLITLTGPGGVGKTRLALEIAQSVAADTATRVAFVPLAAVRTPALVASATADAFGLGDITPLNLPTRLRIACTDRPLLLLLDNFEQVLDAAPLVAELLSSVAALRVLATSRASLHVRGEREYVVGPLSVDAGSEATAPADLARAPAVRLFVERVREVQPDFRLTAANASTVAAICRQLDGLPLALELAAPWMKVLTAEDLLRRLGRGGLHSTAAPRDLPERQQTMNATVAWSYHLLDASEQRAFRRFGVLPGLFPIDAAAEVLAGRDEISDDTDAIRAAAALIDKSLLVRAGGSVVATCPLYHMLETVRAYAAIELAASGEREDALEGLVRYCQREVSLAASGLVGPAQVDWLDRVREDLETYRIAMAWLIECDRAAEACQIGWGMLWFWVIRGHAAEGLRWYEQVLELSSLPPAAESRALLGAAAMWYTQGELARARAMLTRALALAGPADDRDAVMCAQFLLGHVEHAVGNLDAARDQFGRSVEGFRSAQIPWGTGHVLIALSWVALAIGDTAEAERLLDEADSVLRDAGPWFLLLGLYIRAILAVRRGNPAEAIAWVRASLTRIRELRDKFALVYALVPLIAAAVLKGDHAWAARILGARDAVTESTNATVVDTSGRDLLEDAERQARAHLGPHRWALAYAEGRKTSIDSLLQDVDAVV
jgi:predicted ATPase/transcriptional regulator with XRE-family HTH domain